MKNRIVWGATAACIATLAGTAAAHIPSIEPQALRVNPQRAPAAEDYSWESPRVLADVRDSMSIAGYLTHNDVDVFKFTLTAADFARGPVIVSASALAPGCANYQNVYPVTALVGPQKPGPFGPPGLPPADPSLDLPFEVPAGNGVVFADNPEISPRPVFHMPQGEADMGDLKWFLPAGLTQECLQTNPQACDLSHTIAQPVFYPGTYYIVMWNPSGVQTDYTASIGYSEAHYEEPPQDIVELLRDNGLLHRGCADYPKE
ncbi:MAG: hypothetical protein QM778_31245 [Myxococcales bacterium]